MARTPADQVRRRPGLFILPSVLSLVLLLCVWAAPPAGAIRGGGIPALYLIYKDKVVGAEQITVAVGQQIKVAGQFSFSGPTDITWRWSSEPGFTDHNAVKDYTLAEQAKVTYLDDRAVTQQDITFYFVKAGTYKLTLASTFDYFGVENVPATGSVTFKVLAPADPVFTGKMSGIIICKYTAPGSKAPWGMALEGGPTGTTLCVKPRGSSDPGIKFAGSVDITADPDVLKGDLNFVQIRTEAEVFTGKTAAGKPQGESCATGRGADVSAFYAHDTPAGGAKPLEDDDSPFVVLARGFKSVDIVLTEKRVFAIEDYLMYKPAAEDSIWVPVAADEWGFAMQAGYHGGNPPWRIDASDRLLWRTIDVVFPEYDKLVPNGRPQNCVPFTPPPP
jgi:hypothetical protein